MTVKILEKGLFVVFPKSGLFPEGEQILWHMAQGTKIQLIYVICFGATNLEHRDQGNQNSCGGRGGEGVTGKTEIGEEEAPNSLYKFFFNSH